MKYRLFAAILLVLAAMLTGSSPKAALADSVTTITVDPNGQFNTIQLGINEAARQVLGNPGQSFQIVVNPGTYNGAFTPIKGVPIIGSGVETTFINGIASVATLSGVSSVTIRNFTFQNGASISVTGNSSGIMIQNIVFTGAATAVTVAGSSSTSIVNNTFYRNTTAIQTDAELNQITNNIFANNGTSMPATLTQPTYNDFFGGTKIPATDQTSLPNTLHTDSDPKFVDPPTSFRLQAGSPCIGSGNPSFKNRDGSASDMGAFGGPNADLPPMVTGVIGTPAQGSTSSITVTWDKTVDPAATFYRVYYGTASGDYNGANSPVKVAVPTTTATLTDLPTTPPTTPVAPTLFPIVPLDQALQVTWAPVTGATGYRVFYSTKQFDPSTPPTTFFDVGANVTTAKITGLQNGTTYYVGISALAQSQIFIAVTIVHDNSLASNPGSINESPYSKEIAVGLGPVVQSTTTSNVRPEFPEAVSPYPNLKGGGCFIATAAYGFYSAPQVQALRIFRDRYLMTNAPGRAFVAWYYHYGPYGARFITAHPWLKPPVRLLLFPLVLMAIFLIYTPPLAKTAVLMIALVVSVFLYQRSHRPQKRLFVQPGGLR